MFVHDFSDSKAWMNSNIMENVFGRLDRRMNFENRKMILFLDNATCHPESLQNGLTNIKLVFLPKNTASRLQPLDTGIIKSFKLKYRKLLLRLIVSHINDSQTASQIIISSERYRDYKKPGRVLLRKPSKTASESVVLMLKITLK